MRTAVVRFSWFNCTLDAGWASPVSPDPRLAEYAIVILTVVRQVAADLSPMEQRMLYRV
ncbi:MAG: hypothetical protein HY556_08155 [Euryarchaeota archaeon]|nr:hypothetical protein [Euryarchaeota archaeon]